MPLLFSSLRCDARFVFAMLPFSAAQAFGEPHVVASSTGSAWVAAVMDGNRGKSYLIVAWQLHPCYALKPEPGTALEC